MKRCITSLAFAVIVIAAAISCKDKIRVEGSSAPSVYTFPAEDVTYNSVYLSGHIYGTDPAIGSVGFVYDKVDDFDPEHSPREITSAEAKDFHLRMTELESDTEYAFQAFAVLDGEEAFGKTERFRTEPAVFTREPENVGGNSATLLGYIATTKVQDAGFIMDKAGKLDHGTSPRRRNVPHSTYTISSQASTLESNTTYEYCAYIKINDIEKYGDIVSFSTAAVPVTGISLDKGTILLYLEDNTSLQINATVQPSNPTNPKIIWTSSDTGVATVSEGGVVRAVGSGMATIKAASEQAPSVYATCIVIVKSTPKNSVDMGLPSGRLWRDRDLGAKRANYPGDFYAWGETASKKSFFENNYKYYSQDSGSYYPWKYTGSNGHLGKTPDKRTYLEMTDDAARAVLGSPWRIPSYQDYIELKTNTTQQKKEVDGVDGVLFTAKHPDRKGKYNTLFFPEDAYQDGNAKMRIYNSLAPFDPYWLNGVSVDYVTLPGSSTTLPSYKRAAVFYFGQGADVVNEGSLERHFGVRIRPVCD